MAKMQTYRVRKGKVTDRPPGTRCYVPGFQDAATQFEIDQQQLGIAPVVVGAASAVVSGKRVLGVSFKKPSPRVFGGPLVSTVQGFQRDVESGSLSAIQQVDNARKTAKDKSAWQRIWTEMVPTWRINAAQYALIRQLDPTLPVTPPATVTGPVPSQPPPPVAAGPGPVVSPGTPSVGPITISLPSGGGYAPTPTLPIPANQLPGGEAPVEQPAQPTTQGGGILQAGMGGDMGKLMIPGLIIFALTQLAGKGRR